MPASPAVPAASDLLGERIPFSELVARLTELLVDAGADPDIAAVLAMNCAACERDGTLSHGVFRMPGYLHSLRTGWADGVVRSVTDRVSPAFLRVDGRNGFTQPALEAALPDIEAAIAEAGVAVVSVRDAHHTSALWPDLEPYAERGWVAIGMIASGTLLVSPLGASRPVFSTNPFGFATPVAGAPPMVFDYATSAISAGDLELHRQDGLPVQEGTGTDASGALSTDPQAISDGGSMLPFGGHKGALLSLMIETLAAGLSGSSFTFEHDLEQRAAPGGAMTFRTGQLFIIIDPERGGNSAYAGRVAALIDELRSAGVDRLPGDNRYETRERALREGVPVTQLMRDLFAA